MKRRRATVVCALVAAGAGCSLAIDTSGLSGGPALTSQDAAVDVEASLPETGGGGDAEVESGPCSTDLTIDPKNCGRCGHDCLGGACNAAQCAPVTIVRDEPGILGIAVDATDIYWSRYDANVRTSKLDGSGIHAVRKLEGTAHIEVDDTYVYASPFAAGPVSRFRKDGSGDIHPLAPCNGECLGVAVKDGRVYYTQRAPDNVGSLRLVEDDGGATFLLTNLNLPEDVFAGPTQLLVANEGADNVIGLPYGAKESAVVASATDPVSLLTDATDMWIVSQKTKTILRRPLSGGALVTAATLSSPPIGIAQTATAVYWTSNAGTIERLAK